MYKTSVILLLALCGSVVGCDTGSTAENVSTTGWQGQKVGQSSNAKNGPVPSSTTGTGSNIQKAPQNASPAQQNLDSD